MGRICIQQAAEKAVKAVVLAQGGEPSGHLTTALVEALPDALETPATLLDAARRLDKHYIPARYPTGFAAGYLGNAVHSRRGRTGRDGCTAHPRVLPALRI